MLELLFKKYVGKGGVSNKMVARADTKIILRFSFKVKEKHTGWVEVYGER